MMATSLFQVLLLSVLAHLALTAIPGGWSEADISSSQVQGAASFAVQSRFPDLGEDPKFVVQEAFKQVVAGMKYRLLVYVYPPTSSCVQERYEVWDRFGTKTLSEAESLADPCPQ